MFTKKKILIITLLILLMLSCILFLPAIYSISDRLSETARVRANILLVEGWLLPDEIEMANNEFLNNGYDYVITTGIRISGYFQVSMNGYLIFYTNDWLKEIYASEDHLIEIDAYSDMEEENCAHFNVFVNDSMVADFYAGKQKRLYEITWKGKSEKIDSVLVQFD